MNLLNGRVAEPDNVNRSIDLNNSIKSPSAESVNTVILIKPTADESKALINDHFEIVAAVEKSKFGRLNVNNVKTNKRKGLIIATVENSTPAIIAELLAVTSLGKWKVECYLPNKDKFKARVFWPISESTDIEKAKEII